MKLEEVMKYNCLIKELKQEDVIKELEELRKTDSDIYINYLLIRAYNSIGKPEESKRVLQTSKISKEKMLLLEADLELENDNVEKGSKILRKVINMTNSNEAIQKMGNIEEQRGNIDLARYYYEKMIEENPNDAYGLNAIARLEIRNGNLEEVEKLYLKILEIEKTLPQEETLRKNKYKQIALNGLLHLEIKKENYEKAYNYLLEVAKLNYTVHADINRENIYLKNKLGLLNEKNIDFEKLTYYEKQSIKYNKKLALHHIKNHRKENNNKRRHSVFYDHIDVLELLIEVQEKIKNIDPISFYISDHYILIMDEPLGTINGKETNKLKIGTQMNTKNIITMFLLPPHYEEYNEATKENTYTTKKVRTRQSRIEKFNQKYTQFKM